VNETPDTGHAAAAGAGGEFTPQAAALLLEQARWQARRRFEPYPPLFSAFRAVIALATYGTIWLSVRDQHPYRGPDVAACLVVLALAAVNLGAAVMVARRATAGIRGRTRMRPAEGTAMAAAWIGVFVVMGALPAAGASRGVVYGLYPASAPLIVAGLAWAGIMVARANRPSTGTALAVAAIGALAAFAGPAGAWAVAGSGLCVVLLVTAATTAWRHRARAMRP
jgi:hypothetical protein